MLIEKYDYGEITRTAYITCGCSKLPNINLASLGNIGVTITGANINLASLGNTSLGNIGITITGANSADQAATSVSSAPRSQ